MKKTTLSRSVGTAILFTSLFTAQAVAERAETVLKQPGHTNTCDTYINRETPIVCTGCYSGKSQKEGVKNF